MIMPRMYTPIDPMPSRNLPMRITQYSEAMADTKLPSNLNTPKMINDGLRPNLLKQ